MNPLKDKFFIVYLFEWEGTAIYRKILKQKENKSELSLKKSATQEAQRTTTYMTHSSDDSPEIIRFSKIKDCHIEVVAFGTYVLIYIKNFTKKHYFHF